MELGDENFSLVLFEQSPVRRAWHDGRWLYSVVDLIAILVPTKNPRRYWSDLKHKVKEEGFVEVYARIVQLKLPAPDGKLRETDTADMDTVLRIIQSIPSPNVEPVKQWLAGLGASLLENPTEDRKRLEFRGKLSVLHKLLQDTVYHRGIHTPRQHARFKNSGLQELYDGETRDDVAERKGIGEDEDIYAWMYSEELADNIFMEAQSSALITRMDIRGEQALNDAHAQVGRAVRKTIADLGGTMPENLPTPKKSLHQLETEEKRRRIKGMDLFPELDEPDTPPETP